MLLGWLLGQSLGCLAGWPAAWLVSEVAQTVRNVE